MADSLGLWWGEHLVGAFERSETGRIRFVHAEDDADVVVSLSLPRDGEHAPASAAAWLYNLLPDSETVRVRWARTHGTSTDAFDLLSAVGQDVAGALVLLPDGRSPATAALPAMLASQDDLAARVATIVREPDAWTDPQPGRRFSIAGTQGKFTAARVGEDWFWPSATLPSTHIFKPERADLPGMAALEVATLALADRVGVAAARAEVWDVQGQRTFVTERFDRAQIAGAPVRVHAEDLAQALGVRSANKYQVLPGTILTLLRERDPELAHAWVRQLAFNVHVGNADAHAKNYSLILEGGRVVVAPLYDALVTAVWPEYDRRLAMHIAGADHAPAVTPAHWAKFARRNGLDPDRVVDEVRTIATGVQRQAVDVLREHEVPAPLRDAAIEVIAATTKGMTVAVAGPTQHQRGVGAFPAVLVTPPEPIGRNEGPTL